MSLPLNDPYLYPATNHFSADPLCETALTLHKNYTHGMHVHDFYELNIIVAGTGEHHIGERCVAVHVGDVFVIPPLVPHGYAGDGLDVFHVLIHPRLLERQRDFWNATPGYSALFNIEPYLRQSAGETFFLQLDAAELYTAQQALEQAQELHGPTFYAYRSFVVSHLIATLCLTMHRHVQGSTHSADRGMFQILEYIHRHLSEPLSLTRLAQATHMSRATFARRFQSIVGLSPMTYVRQCRLRLASELLAQGNLSKTDVAIRCGFYDAAHLNKYLHGKA